MADKASSDGIPGPSEAPVRPRPSARVGADELLLKWGTLKGWDAKSEPFIAALRKYEAAGGLDSISVMQARDTPEQKELLCEVIDACDGRIQNDWTGEIMTKEAAKSYVREYGR